MAESSVKILRSERNESEDKYSPRKVSISKASNLTVALSGGTSKSKMGVLKRRSNSVFATFRENFVAVDDGDLVFQSNEDDIDRREVYSLLSIREIRLVGSGSCQFQLKLASEPCFQGSSPTSSSSSLQSTLKDLSNTLKVRHVVLKASTHHEAMEWIATIKHELKNQILVCKTLYSTLQSEGHPERAEPLFQQMIELLKVVYDGREHFEVADALRSYGKWLAEQGRNDDALFMKRQAKAIKRRCEEGLDNSLPRSEEPPLVDIGQSPPEGKSSSPSLAFARLPPLRKT